jgi:hypothetical protein
MTGHVAAGRFRRRPALDALLEAGHLAETIVGRRLPGSLLRSGPLAQFRRNAT